jgi:hypothetical protein
MFRASETEMIYEFLIPSMHATIPLNSIKSTYYGAPVPSVLSIFLSGADK